MTDREQLLNVLNITQSKSIEDILTHYFYLYEGTISARRMYSLIQEMNKHLEYKIQKLDEARFVGAERAAWIKKYLEGKMWPDEETAKFYLQPQIDNAQAIIDACKL
jgi:hypothetical protein